jgi:histone-lysine N-methyltransferase SETMAR
LSFELFEMLWHQKDRVWHDIVTLDESWFYFTTGHEWIWFSEGTEAPERERIIIQSRKMMVTIDWNPTGFYRIVALPKGTKLNPDYYISHIFHPPTEWRRSQIGGSDRRLHVYADNARPHTAKKVTEFLAGNGMKRASHPPYSLDLAPCDFYVFGYIKDRLAGASSEEPDQLLQAIDAIFQSIKKSTVECVSQKWMDRLAQCCMAVGGFVEAA